MEFETAEEAAEAINTLHLSEVCIPCVPNSSKLLAFLFANQITHLMYFLCHKSC